MKPRKRPGSPGSAGKAEREAIAKAKPVNASLLHHESQSKKVNKKEGRGGEKAHWDIDLQEGAQIAKKKMKGAENETFSTGGVRKLPKNR